MWQRRWFSSSTPTDGDYLPGHNAYEILGVEENSTFAEIKTAFRRIAKETHPDVSPDCGASASRRFLLVLAAYEVRLFSVRFLPYFPLLSQMQSAVQFREVNSSIDMEISLGIILSDSERRGHYDSYLLSQRRVLQKHHGQQNDTYIYYSSVNTVEKTDVVEWLEIYRLAIDDILFQRKISNYSGYIGEIENEMYSAIRAAYYGPLVESFEFLPECFEAEERSGYETSEVLHLVTGRDLFGMVNLVNHVPQLPQKQNESVAHLGYMYSAKCQLHKCRESSLDLTSSYDEEDPYMQVEDHNCHISDSFDDLELHISGRVVATANRILPRNFSSDNLTDEPQDLIHVFLNQTEEHSHLHPGKGHFSKLSFPSSFRSSILLGTIRGLGSSAEEGPCFVYDRNNKKTHVIMKHRTLMVKHMHWYEIGDEVSTCECRCSRARLPPSKFWLFAPRCGLHDVGGWYIETFGRDRNGRNIQSQRQWEGDVEHHERRLHPAMYLMALAYRTLDIEVSRRRKRTIRDAFKPMLSNILSWWRRLA